MKNTKNVHLRNNEENQWWIKKQRKKKETIIKERKIWEKERRK